MSMTSKQFRHSHFLALIEELGTIEAIAKRTGLNPQYLSQLKNETRGIGNKTARTIESKMGWPEGAMDRPPSDEGADKELTYLIKTLPENETINAISEALPGISREGLNQLTTALLAQLNASSSEQE